ncbi:MAG: exodeoxyribonuclease VII large subunit [Calditrichia bacterium]
MEKRVYSVTELTRQIKDVLENSFPRIWLEAEISNFKHHSSGHFYFTLKDENSQIKAVMWRFRASALAFRPEDGMKVLVEGDIQLYERGGYYQIVVNSMQPAGIGDLQLAFEQLKRKLHAEGLFDEARKRPLPPYPEKIGVVTSPTGAAIRDIISVIRRRSPQTQLFLVPVRVQGVEAAPEIAQAIRDFNDFGDVDLLIVGRGGGSLEDLWPFNEEIVARAIYNSKIPVISAVGHEVDFSIADFVADRRAPTPSAAAEIAVADRAELMGVLAYYRERMQNALKQNVSRQRERIRHLRNSYGFRKPEDMVFQKMQRLDELRRQMEQSLQHRVEISRQKLANFKGQFRALNPRAVLQRGYSICYKDGKVIKSSRQVQPLDMVEVKLASGHLISQVTMIGDGE